jgi:hypothetical protein
MIASALCGFLVVASIAICTMCVAVMPELLDLPTARSPIDGRTTIDMSAPVREFVLPMFVRGKLSEKGVARDGRIGFASLNPGHEWDAFNLGETMGLRGLWSLAPLGAVWIACGVVIARALRRHSAR